MPTVTSTAHNVPHALGIMSPGLLQTALELLRSTVGNVERVQFVFNVWAVLGPFNDLQSWSAALAQLQAFNTFSSLATNWQF